jgi:CTP:molybdopterin cytidylyltransferase MocA
MKKANVSAIILAAGLSTRMQGFKPLLRIGEKTIIEHAIALFQNAGIDEIVTVVGYRSEQLIPVVKAASSRYVVNSNYHAGMYSSIQKGIKALRHPCDAFFLLPVDIPLVRPSTISLMLNAFFRNSFAMVWYPQFKKRRGHPPLINSQLINEILSYSGQGGIRELLRRHETHAISIPVEDPFIRMDADTRQDLSLLKEKYLLIESLPLDQP